MSTPLPLLAAAPSRPPTRDDDGDDWDEDEETVEDAEKERGRGPLGGRPRSSESRRSRACAPLAATRCSSAPRRRKEAWWFDAGGAGEREGGESGAGLKAGSASGSGLTGRGSFCGGGGFCRRKRL